MAAPAGDAVVDWPRRINRAMAKISPWWIYGLGFIPAAWYFWLGATGSLSANPVQAFEHLLGEWTLRFLIATLLVTPIRDLTRVNLFRFRRALGLMSFYYALMHVLTYAILDRALVFPEIVADVIKRPYIMVGMAAFVGLVALAVTSNNWSIRKMGRNWGRLHLLIYPAAILGVTHFIMAVKSWPPRPLIYIAIIAVLLLYRLAKYTAAQRPFASA
ncbi:sulfoxide reductase heme-binding subunit YedZ [Rhizobium sp. SG_E_25_P2]|uniref:protein-methionine-sulfoxide reductase heme-binding subunit MsrQ n=1 Tax=Rhizobium sp. SG_E_25_P2 TaxID=2879942 RepID=UPI00247707FE|nr:protein-methionine-sulfoxide reductase heme-binding subunit MsrQ [Rhizobium sp. SG_E_25_P2]MDH6269745.1 sulfoxide reductase heme-binding subunit YedZ [Rhizobium sp. SG_E_25_P2]